jgi:flagellar hook-associated protein 2
MVRLGIAEPANDSLQALDISEGSVKEAQLPGDLLPSESISISDGVLRLPSLTAASIPLNLDIEQGSPMVLRIETETAVQSEGTFAPPKPPPGPSIPSSGSISYGGITIENAPSEAPLPEWTPPPPPPRLDNLAVLSLTFSDGTKASLPPITDTESFSEREFRLADVAGGKTITALNIENANTHREIAVQNATVLDPTAVGSGFKPLNPVTTAQDAIISMEGIEMTRPSNTINDIIPGVTVTARGVSERPVRLAVGTDREGVKNAIITLVGTYNRLMAEVNVLTRSDPVIIDELTYLSKEEAEEMRARLGSFAGDSSLSHLRTNLQRAASSPYPTDLEKELSMLAQIGISTNTRGGASGYNPARLRGYLEIDEKALDVALDKNLGAVRQLFGSNSQGELIVDTGVAFTLDAVSRPFVETGGIIALKTGTIDSRISQDKRRIATLDRQLADKEAQLKMQYSQMESAWSRMEQTSSSIDSFSRNNNNNNR